jgi:nucleotide-binding universal stress UspA family protein
VAEQESADLIVVGAHQRSALARLRDGSVSRELLQQTDQSVVCVPATAAPRELVVPAFRTVLVATDFSPAGDAAVALALAAAAPGARLHLLHVATEDIEPGGSVAAAEHRAAETRLAELVPSGAGVVTEIHVLSGRDPALVISHVAERLGADLVCLGSHGRTGLGRMLMGSVTQEVIARLRRPILLARPALE